MPGRHHRGLSFFALCAQTDGLQPSRQTRPEDGPRSQPGRTEQRD